MSIKITFNPKVYPDLTRPQGLLVRDMACQACWTFFTLAEKMRHTVGDGAASQILIEGEPWMDKRYEQLATSVALQYGLSSPDEWERFWPLVERQAVELGFNPPAQEYRGRKRFSFIQ